jgi:hypothetical protein
MHKVPYAEKDMVLVGSENIVFRVKKVFPEST